MGQRRAAGFAVSLRALRLAFFRIAATCRARYLGPGMRIRDVIGATLWLALGGAAPAAAQISIGGPGVDPEDFRITVFASDLPYPTSLQALDDGSLLVLTNAPTAGLFDSTGQLVRLVDADGDGVADGPPVAVYSGLPGIATSVRRWRDLVFVSSRELDNETITILRTGAAPAEPYLLAGTIDLAYPAGAQVSNHRNVALAVGPGTVLGTDVDLVFNIGSELNAEATAVAVVGGGLLEGLVGAGAMAMDALHRVSVTDAGDAVSLSNLVQVGAGLRNAAGIAFDPASGDLYFSENGIDPAVGVSQSADELNRISAISVGAALLDFGFPSDFVEYRTGEVATGLSVQPLVAFQPVPDPLTGAESEGPVEIAFAPTGFPAPLRGGVFVGFHGRFSASGAANEENPVVFVDLDSLEYFHFVANTEPALGHPNALLATSRSLFIADLASGGSVFTNTATGVIHQIRALDPVEVPVLGIGAAGSLGLLLSLGLGVAGGWRLSGCAGGRVPGSEPRSRRWTAPRAARARSETRAT